MRPRAVVIDAASALPAVALPEVLARADLQTRSDRKYLVPVPAFAEFAAALARQVAALQINRRRSFRYESVYFDTPDLLTFRQHRQGRRRRYKVRTRTYVDTRQCHLEVKLEGQRESTVKQRVPYPYDDRGQLTAAARDFVDGQVRHAYAVTPPSFVPVLSTTYRRTTLVDRPGATRITCDTDMVCAGPYRAVAASDHHILVEIKSAHPEGYADRLLWSLGVRPARISKYCLAVAALHPWVHANPWYPALRACFGRHDRARALPSRAAPSNAAGNLARGTGEFARAFVRD